MEKTKKLPQRRVGISCPKCKANFTVLVASVLGKITSKAKTKAAAKNGLAGGRPRRNSSSLAKLKAEYNILLGKPPGAMRNAAMQTLGRMIRRRSVKRS